MVGAHLPEGAFALHTCETNQGVHQRVLERMPHVQGAGDVGRRDHDAVGLALLAGIEESGSLPPGIER